MIHRRNRSQMPQACSFIKKETLAQVLSCEFCQISKNIFFTEHLWATASEYNRNPTTVYSASNVEN